MWIDRTKIKSREGNSKTARRSTKIGVRADYFRSRT